MSAKLVGVSLKMYMDRQQTRQWLIGAAAVGRAEGAQDVEMFVLPSFLAIRDAQELLSGSGVDFGAQDVFWEDSGAFTGEISAPMLRAEGCRYVEVGHAERRRLFGEDDECTAAKAVAVARSGMTPVVCVGERICADVSSAVAQCLPQVTSVLDRLAGPAPVVFAYEPVWAIGKDVPAPAAHVAEVVTVLRAACAGYSGSVRFIYGGSAGPGTYSELAGAVDGLFLGRFAHDIKNLQTVIHEISAADRTEVTIERNEDHVNNEGHLTR